MVRCTLSPCGYRAQRMIRDETGRMRLRYFWVALDDSDTQYMVRYSVAGYTTTMPIHHQTETRIVVVHTSCSILERMEHLCNSKTRSRCHSAIMALHLGDTPNTTLSTRLIWPLLSSAQLSTFSTMKNRINVVFWRLHQGSWLVVASCISRFWST